MLNDRCGTDSSEKRKPRSVHLAACLAAALGLGGFAEVANAAEVTVADCTDGALRSSVIAAGEGGTVDMDGLTCSTITLTAGEIPITVNALTFNGPTNHTLTINGKKTGRVFDHTGTGTVTLQYLSLTNGFAGPVAGGEVSGSGGCIYSKGSVSLTHSSLSACEAGYGSAVSANGNIELTRSIVTGNTAHATGEFGLKASTITSGGVTYVKYAQIDDNYGYGIYSGNIELIDANVDGNSDGGISARGYISLTGSTIDGNYGTGIAAYGAVTVSKSTISDNRAGGGIRIQPYGISSTPTLTITDSTISGNSSEDSAAGGGGIFANKTAIKISNSTIAYNSALESRGGGIFATDCGTFTLQSSIIVGNSQSSVSGQSYADAYLKCLVTGSNNLVGVLSFSLQGTLTGPAGLTPLGYHGGPVRTHALLATSPAIDAGNNLLNLAGDERGLPRMAGPPDIGAYERQPNDDEIFYNGYE